MSARDTYLVILNNRNINNNWRFSINNTSDRETSEVSNNLMKLPRSYGSVVVNSSIETKDIQISGVMRSDNDSDLQSVMSEFDKIKGTQKGYLSFVPEFKKLANTEVANTPTPITIGNKFKNLTYLTNNGEVDKGCFSVDFDPSNPGTAGFGDIYIPVNNGDLGADFSSIADKGGFGLFIYLPKPVSFSTNGIKLIINSGGGNYRQFVSTSNLDGNSVTNGWNFVKFSYSNSSTVGTLNWSNVTNIIIEYSVLTSSPAMNGIIISAPVWFNTKRARLYNVYPKGSTTRAGNYNMNTYTDFKSEFLIPEGYGKDLEPVTVYSGSITNAPLILDVDFEGSLPPLPSTSILMNSITSGGGVRIANNQTSQGIEIISTISTGDLIEIGGENENISKNGQAVDANGIIPRFNIGYNQVRVELIPPTKTVITTVPQASRQKVTTRTNNRAQSLTMTATGVLESLKFGVYNAVPNIFNWTWFGICADSGGFPAARFESPSGTGTPQSVGTWLFTDTYFPSSVQNAYSVITLNPNLSVTNGQTLWFVWTQIYLGGHVEVDLEFGAGNPYAGGVAVFRNFGAGSWTSSGTSDLSAFDVTINTLTGYTGNVNITYDRLYP